MAIGLVILGAMMALPVAIGVWALGLVSFGDAVLLYVLGGWSVIAAGFLSTVFSHIVQGLVGRKSSEPQAVTMKVKANRS